MKEQGITVLRFTGKKVDLELQAVSTDIDDKIREMMGSKPTQVISKPEES